ncbi:MAG: hypothetical protein WB760_24010 [Xanthobacteraceae bacterium]
MRKNAPSRPESGPPQERHTKKGTPRKAHYVFVVWPQYTLLGIPLPAVIKAAIVFGLALLFTWIIATTVPASSLGRSAHRILFE